MRFLISRRWLLLALAVVVLAYGCYWLGRWQFHRLAERRADNAIVAGNEHRTSAQVSSVLAVGRPVSAADQWRPVVATGRYDDAHTVVIRYQTHNGEPGVDVVTPLVTSTGAAVLVDRGWLHTQNFGNDRPNVPSSPSGMVSVQGWLRVDGTGSSTVVTQASARAISSAEIAKTVPYPVYGGFVDLTRQTPASAHPLALSGLPSLGDGPHFFYGLQWWFFGVLAVFGFGYFAYDERRQALRRSTPQTEPQSERSIPPSTGTIAPVTKEAAGDSRNAATRPNSAGSP